MRTADLMSQPIRTCLLSDNLDVAARLMWDHDCGVVPVVKEDGRIAGIVTDRDICMAAYTQGKTLAAIPVGVAMAKQVVCCHADDSVEATERLMTDNRVRRVPVLDVDDRPIGIVSVSDIARRAAASPGKQGLGRELVRGVARICQPRRQEDLAASPEPLMLCQDMSLAAEPGGRSAGTVASAPSKSVAPRVSRSRGSAA